jgi:hypothetical protein
MDRLMACVSDHLREVTDLADLGGEEEPGASEEGTRAPMMYNLGACDRVGL